jgi:hypothetical protein
MLFFSRTTHRTLASLADRLDRPEIADSSITSADPLLRRILARVERLLSERRDLRAREEKLSQNLEQITSRLAERDVQLQQLETRWELAVQGSGDLFWEMELGATTQPDTDSALRWLGSWPIQTPSSISGASGCTRVTVSATTMRCRSILQIAAAEHPMPWTFEWPSKVNIAGAASAENPAAMPKACP